LGGEMAQTRKGKKRNIISMAEEMGKGQYG